MGEMADDYDYALDAEDFHNYIYRKSTMEIILKNVRLAFFNGYEPGNYEGKLTYGAQLIIRPDDPQIAELDAACDAVAKAKWNERAPAIMQDLRAKDRVCFRHGPKKNGEGVPYDGFEGMYHCSTSCKVEQPPLLLKANKEISTPRDGDLYGGCYAAVKLELWAQDNQYGKRINAQCKVFQKRADGDAFTGGTPPTADGMEDLSDVGSPVDDLMG